MSCATAAEFEYEKIASVTEKYMDNEEEEGEAGEEEGKMGSAGAGKMNL